MKLKYIPFYCILLLFLAGCKQDFNVTADYKETPVVYGLLNSQDTRHFLRIQKGFLIEGNAYVAAGVPDSIYYPDVLTVTLKASDGSATFNLRRINGDTLTTPMIKDSGAFAKNPNILYTFDGALDPSKTYNLEITNNENGKKILSSTTIVKDFSVFLPLRGTQMNLISTNPPAIRWNLAENANLYDFTVRIHFTEHKFSDPNYSKDTFIDIPFLKVQPQEYVTGGFYEVRFNSAVVLGYMASRMEANNDIYREYSKVRGMHFIYGVGGTELGKYISSRSAQGGITSNEALPPYTNIDGGVGLLSSRYFKTVDSVFLSNDGIDSIACQDLTRPLKFKNHNGVICN